MPIKKINIAHINYIAEELGKQQKPERKFTTLYPERVQSCITETFAHNGKRETYPSVTSKAAALFYFIIKNYAFAQGNERIALASMLSFLYLNDLWLEVDPRELANFTKWVVASPSLLKDATISAVGEYIEKQSKNLSTAPA